ncbi:hypothetical protein WI73_00600 [Burkholderia ubonensis]|uniref:hypothetical protein n=1 Tax=Burkholderia ubonensis TaxID=101571 RepID=UPI00075215A3|nr:hypothetical protein [Burkholderia ubonensis]KVC70969.1 hypothetical protein WI73_00600 [Burkholderia ubonensis]
MAFTKQSEIAELCGVSRQAVFKRVMQSARVDADAPLALLGRVRKGGSPVQLEAGNDALVDIEIQPGESLDQAAERLAGEIDVNSTSFDEARRIKEVYLALLHRLDFEKKSSVLVELDTASTVPFEEFRAQRDAWLNWPTKVGPLIGAELGVEADKITAVLSAHVHKQIAQLGEPEVQFSQSS